MKKTVACVILAVFLAGCFHQREKTADPVLPQDLRIVSIGDSLTQGVGDSRESGGYVPYLQKRLEALETVDEVFFDNYGKRGNRTDQLLRRLEDKTIQEKIQQSDFVIVTIGGNDVVEVMKNNWSNLTIEDFQREEESYAVRIESILRKIRTINANAGIVLVGIYNPFSRIFVKTADDEEIVRSWNNRAKAITEKFNQTAFVTIEDVFAAGNDDLFFEDQFHPNDQGYEQIAGRIFESIEDSTLEELTNGKIAGTSGGSH